MAKLKRSAAGCPNDAVAQAMKRIGGRWKVLIIRDLLEGGGIGFNELQRRLGSVSPKMLSQQLSELQADGIVVRHEIVPEPPKTVRYELTPHGESLRPVIDALGVWGAKCLQKDDEVSSASLDRRRIA